MNKDTIVDHLKESICRILFVKANGTERTLIGTLRSDLIEKQIEEQKKNQPEKRKPTSKKPPRTVPDTMVNVLELDPPQWRTFVIARLLKFEVRNEDGTYTTVFEQDEVSSPTESEDSQPKSDKKDLPF